MKIAILSTFNLEISKVKKINLKQASEEELQKHIYLRKYKNKIIELRAKGEDPMQAIPHSDPKYNWIIQYIK